MKAYAITCIDKPGSAALREQHAGAHLAHVEANIDTYLVAGPLRDEAGATVGSLLVVKADSADAARAFLEADPYHAAGFWDAIRITEFWAVAGDWVGGIGWK